MDVKHCSSHVNAKYIVKILKSYKHKKTRFLLLNTLCKIHSRYGTHKNKIKTYQG